MNFIFTESISIGYGIVILSLVPVLVVSSDRILEMLRPNEIHHRLNIYQMILYITLLIIGIIGIYLLIQKYITNELVKKAVTTLIGPIITVTSTHLNDSVKQYL